jgi:hypothetical protein
VKSLEVSFFHKYLFDAAASDNYEAPAPAFFLTSVKSFKMPTGNR